jgi:hypothetical protein
MLDRKLVVVATRPTMTVSNCSPRSGFSDPLHGFLTLLADARSHVSNEFNCPKLSLAELNLQLTNGAPILSENCKPRFLAASNGREESHGSGSADEAFDGPRHGVKDSKYMALSFSMKERDDGYGNKCERTGQER